MVTHWTYARRSADDRGGAYDPERSYRRGGSGAGWNLAREMIGRYAGL